LLQRKRGFLVLALCVGVAVLLLTLAACQRLFVVQRNSPPAVTATPGITPDSSAYPEATSVPAPSENALPYPVPVVSPSEPQATPVSDTQSATVYLPGILAPQSQSENGAVEAATATVKPSPKPTRRATKTPSPTRTPEVPWPEPLAGPSHSRLGIHVQWNNSPDIMEFVRRMKPAVVKGVDDLGWLEEVKAVSPSTVTIGRLSAGQANMEGDPIQVARAFVATNLEQYKRHPGVDYWEGYNEPVVHGRMAWFATFEAERTRLMAEQGLRTAVGAFSTGVPEWDEMEAFLPAIAAAKQYKGIFTLHEYDAPTMERSVGMALPGRPSYANRGVLTLRYRWWYEDFLKPRGLVVPLAITEAGVDGAVGNRPGPKGLGWQDFTGYWAQNGLGTDSIRTYLNQLQWYDKQLQQDDYVIGFTVFTAGAMNDDWHSFDITPILRHIAAFVILPQK
jgi:hypothetical protein